MIFDNLNSTTTTTSANLNNIFLVTFGTAALSSLNLEFDSNNMYPTTNISYEKLEQKKSWDLDDDELTINSEQIKVIRNIDTLKSFSTSIVENSQSLDEEAIEIVNQNFWDWL